MTHDFQLSVTAISDDPLVFIANTSDTEDTLSLTANGGYMLYLQNTSPSRVIKIEKIMASASTPGVVMRWMKSVTIDGLNNNNIHAPVNINGNEDPTEIVCFNWNEIGDGILNIDKGMKVKTYILDIGHTGIKVNATLGAFDNMALHFKHDKGMPEIECGIQFSYQIAEQTEAESKDE